MDTLFTVFVIATAVFALPLLVRQLQMLQQNSYFAIRYIRWYKGIFGVKEIVRITASLLGAAAAAGVFGYRFPIGAAVCAFTLLFLAVTAIMSVSAERKSVKRLAVTARVKRMFAASAVIYTVLAVLSLILPSGRYIAAVLFFVSCLPQLGTLMTLTVMKPVEKTISRHFEKDAKRILSGSKNLRVIGVTGSYGKTSTKVILGRILSEKYNTLITPENYNTPMGVVITVRTRLLPQHEIFIAEMGAKKKGDIAEICDIARPDFGVITSVGPQHLDTFGNIETVAATKFELADRVKQNGGKMFLNTDNKYIKERSGSYDCVTYGTEDCDCKAENITYSPEGLSFTIKTKDVSFGVTSGLLGTHNALNITAAAAVALHLGLSPDEIAYAVSKLRPVAHRLEMKKYIGGSTLIDDAYNSNPEGCLEAVHVLGSFIGMKKIIVTPGLVELGKKEYECNRRLGAEAAKYSDEIILVGKKRSVPLLDGVKAVGFDQAHVSVVSSFAEAVTVFRPMCDDNTVILFENDLPDNYLN